jgi:hypothetical protein
LPQTHGGQRGFRRRGRIRPRQMTRVTTHTHNEQETDEIGYAGRSPFRHDSEFIPPHQELASSALSSHSFDRLLVAASRVTPAPA